jgi:hypothetical protein
MTKEKLPITGQGVFIFRIKNNECEFFTYNHNKTEGLKVTINNNDVIVKNIATNQILFNNLYKNKCLSNGKYYWFSIDSKNQILYAGIGEVRLETVIYHYKYDKSTYHENKLFLESICHIHFDEYTIKSLKILKDPITTKIPLIIKDTDHLTMNDIANGTYMPKANLSLISQKLYDCICGKNFILNDADFPDFTNAIEKSILSPNGWCNKKLIEKSTEFSKDKPNILETYLRITLGQNNGESPGIPYVMEIWPIGHYSPIHNHSDANAIIRVLHGKINVQLYSYLDKNNKIKPFAEKQFDKDDITWISPTLNQTHKLTNLPTNKETCITIQCYMYDSNDKSHYDYFDYIEDGKIEQYDPDSDMDFIIFKELMKEEWNNC